MAHSDRSRGGTNGESTGWSANQKSVASLVLFIHLFCMAVALGANHAPSALQNRLLTVFRPFTRLLNFDVSQIRFDLTQEAPDDTDPRIEYLPPGKNPVESGDWVPVGRGMRGSDRWTRYQRLANLLGIAGTGEDTDSAARVTQAVGEYLAIRQGVELSQIRCRRHQLQLRSEAAGAGERRNPDDPSFFQEAYRAQVAVDKTTREVLVQKVEERGQVAPPTRASGRATSPTRSSSNTGNGDGDAAASKSAPKKDVGDTDVADKDGKGDAD